MKVLVTMFAVLSVLGCATAETSSQSEVAITKAKMKKLEKDLAKYFSKNKIYPPDLPSGDAVDGWQKSFIYTGSGEHFKLISLGSDGQEGGIDEATDLVLEK